jgi:hypothetical protein
MDRPALEKLCDPGNYLGEGGVMVDRVLARTGSVLGKQIDQRPGGRILSRYDDPLDLLGAGRALVILDHGVEQGGNLLARDGDERGDKEPTRSF